MAKNRYINTHFWDDDFIIKLDPTEKLLFLYCLTNTLTNLCGIYEITLRRMSFDTGIDGAMITNIMKRFEKSGKIKYDGKWIAIKNFMEHQSFNHNMQISVDRELKLSPVFLVQWVKSRIPNPSEPFGRVPCPSLPPIKLNIDKNVNKNKDIETIVNYLNDKSGKSFHINIKKTQGVIIARMTEGRTVDDFKKVIDLKCSQWKLDPNWSKYLRPETLFGNKFEGYLNEAPKPSKRNKALDEKYKNYATEGDPK